MAPIRQPGYYSIGTWWEDVLLWLTKSFCDVLAETWYVCKYVCVNTVVNNSVPQCLFFWSCESRVCIKCNQQIRICSSSQLDLPAGGTAKSCVKWRELDPLKGLESPWTQQCCQFSLALIMELRGPWIMDWGACVMMQLQLFKLALNSWSKVIVLLTWYLACFEILACSMMSVAVYSCYKPF